MGAFEEILRGMKTDKKVYAVGLLSSQLMDVHFSLVINTLSCSLSYHLMCYKYGNVCLVISIDMCAVERRW